MPTKSFHEILQEKLDLKPFSPQSPPAELDPAGLAFLIGRVDRFHFKSKAKYVTPSSALPAPKTSPRRDFDSCVLKKATVREPGPAHHLSDSQKKSFDFFAQSDIALEIDFSADELKTSFRKLALIFHPDRGGDEKTFILLKNHYDSLRFIFKQTK